MQRFILSCAFVFFCLAGLARADEFKTFDEAYAAGNAAFLKKDYEAAITALDAALKLAGPGQQLEPRNRLKTIYQRTRNVDGLVAMFDDELVSGGLKEHRWSTTLQFMREQKRFELFEQIHGIYLARLEKKPDDYPALSIAWAAIRSAPDAPDREESQRRYEKAEAKVSEQHAQHYESLAARDALLPSIWYAMAAECWSEVGNGARVETAVAKSLAARSPKANWLDDEMMHKYIGNAYLNLGRIDEAAASYEAAIKLKPSEARVLRARIDKAKQKRDRPDPKEARAKLEHAIAQATTERERLDLYQQFGDVCAELGDVPGIMKANDYLVTHQTTGRLRGHAAIHFHDALRKLDAIEYVLPIYQKRASESRDDFAAVEFLAIDTLGKKRTPEIGALRDAADAAELVLAKRDAEAAEREAVARPETTALSYSSAALAWREAEDFGRMNEARSKALAAPALKDPKQARLMQEQLAEAMHFAKQWDEAGEHYEAALKIDAPGTEEQTLKRRLADTKRKALFF